MGFQNLFARNKTILVLKKKIFSFIRSVNEVICHGIPDDRSLEEGDIVNLDITVYKKGFHADLNETYCVGKVSDSSKFLVF